MVFPIVRVVFKLIVSLTAEVPKSGVRETRAPLYTL